MKYLSEKELMEIPATNESNERARKITKKYPILKELGKKLNYEQFANLFFLVDYLYRYQEMWEEVIKSYNSNEKYLDLDELKDKYFPKFGRK